MKYIVTILAILTCSVTGCITVQPCKCPEVRQQQIYPLEPVMPHGTLEWRTPAWPEWPPNPPDTFSLIGDFIQGRGDTLIVKTPTYIK